MNARCRRLLYKRNKQNDAAMSVDGDGKARRTLVLIAIGGHGKGV